MKGSFYTLLLSVAYLIGCSNRNSAKINIAETRTKLIYFGFDDHLEKPQDVVRLGEVWGGNKVCSHWRSTVNEKDADYRVLFGSSTLTIIGRRGALLYTGGQGVLYLPHGNPDGSGVNVCKLTGE
jgi:hypothetical protein